MAKWGEGDPRWIVEERPDATNVNNWHWTEKNADSWSKTRLCDIFNDLQMSLPTELSKSASIVITFTGLDKCEGEARVNNRKGRLIYFYEWNLCIKFKADVKQAADVPDDDTTIEGTVSVPNFSEEHDDLADVDIVVNSEASRSTEFLAVREYLCKGGGSKKIRDKLQTYIDSLKKEFSQGLILETKSTAKSVRNGNGQVAASTNNKFGNLSLAGKTDNSTAPATAMSSPPPPLSTIKFDEIFKCTGQEIYNALTQRELIEAFSQSTVGNMSKSTLCAGCQFTLLNGNIICSFIDLKPFTSIRMKWRLKSWTPPDHFSTVTIDIDQRSDDTVVRVSQVGVPEREVEATRQGWRRYYWDAIRNNLGYGSNIF